MTIDVSIFYSKYFGNMPEARPNSGQSAGMFKIRERKNIHKQTSDKNRFADSGKSSLEISDCFQKC